MKRTFALVLLLAGCAESDPRASVPRATAQDAAAACKQFTNEGLKLKAKSRAGLEAEAGRASKTDVQVEDNRHVPNVQDTIFRYHYDGLEVQLRRPGPGGEMFEYVAVSKRKWLNFPYFQPGVSAENITAVLGEPQRREGDNLVYECGGGDVEAPVVFETDGKTVKRIVFNYYVD